MREPIGDDAAKAMRRLWFAYLDALEPARPGLHALCLKLTGSVFDAEDLAQEALLRGFGAMARGDLFTQTPAIQSPRAYLGRIAANLWIDGQRRSGREVAEPDADAAVPAGDEAVITPAAGAALFERAAPQERAAVVLKDALDLSIDEIAVILATTPGAVKSALRRGRGKLEAARREAKPLRGASASPALIDRFVAAFNARDPAAIAAVLSERVVYEASGVGGEIGKGAIWVAVNADRPEGVRWARARFEGEDIAIGLRTRRNGRDQLLGVSRFEEVDGRISRHVGYFFTPETLALIAEALGMDAASHGYHQDPETLERMIADSTLPWRGT
jgi:RNA polymerase sigma-70 factor (ECF subfamily)